MFYKTSSLQSLQISSDVSTHFICFKLIHPYSWRDMILARKHLPVKLTTTTSDQFFIISLNINKSTVTGSSHLRFSVRKDLLRNFSKLTGKCLCWSIFLICLSRPEPGTLLKKRFLHRYFPVNFAKFLRIPFLQNTSRRLLLSKLHSILF